MFEEYVINYDYINVEFNQFLFNFDNLKIIFIIIKNNYEINL